MPRTRGGWALMALLVAWPSAARADAEPSVQPATASDGGSPYRLKWEYDLPLVGLGLATTMAGFVGYSKPACLPACTPPQSMWGIDDAVVGNYSPRAHTAADIMVLSMIAVPLVVDAIDSRMHGWLEDSAVLLETIVLAQGLTQLTKSSVGRLAPLIYNPSAAREDLESPDAGRSFFSGHTTTAFAAATAYSVTFWKRHPSSPWRFVVLAVGQALATTVGILKIEAGYHYPTDIAAGALVGMSLGLLVPVLHSSW